MNLIDASFYIFCMLGLLKYQNTINYFGLIQFEGLFYTHRYHERSGHTQSTQNNCFLLLRALRPEGN